MSSINPFSGYVAQGTQVERTQAGEKSRQIRETQVQAKNAAQRDDEMQHQVESSDAISAIHDEQNPARQRKRKSASHQQSADQDDEQPRLDITA